MPELTVRLFISHPWVAALYTRLLSESPGIRVIRDSAHFDVGIVDSASFDCPPARVPAGPRRGAGRSYTTLPGGASLENAKMLVLVTSAGEDECRRWLRAGACGVLAYGHCAGGFARAVHQAASGQVCAPVEAVRAILVQHEQQSAQFPGLTARERAVAAVLLTGLTNQEIADELHISLSTVKSHIASIYRKEGAHSRAGFISFAAQFHNA